MHEKKTNLSSSIQNYKKPKVGCPRNISDTKKPTILSRLEEGVLSNNNNRFPYRIHEESVNFFCIYFMPKDSVYPTLSSREACKKFSGSASSEERKLIISNDFRVEALKEMLTENKNCPVLSKINALDFSSIKNLDLVNTFVENCPQVMFNNVKEIDFAGSEISMETFNKIIHSFRNLQWIDITECKNLPLEKVKVILPHCKVAKDTARV